LGPFPRHREIFFEFDEVRQHLLVLFNGSDVCSAFHRLVAWGKRLKTAITVTVDKRFGRGKSLRDRWRGISFFVPDSSALNAAYCTNSTKWIAVQKMLVRDRCTTRCAIGEDAKRSVRRVLEQVGAASRESLGSPPLLPSAFLSRVSTGEQRINRK
jgi:hypothetical protein